LLRGGDHGYKRSVSKNFAGVIREVPAFIPKKSCMIANKSQGLKLKEKQTKK
jgi:hypothetical protein